MPHKLLRASLLVRFHLRVYRLESDRLRCQQIVGFEGRLVDVGEGLHADEGVAGEGCHCEWSDIAKMRRGLGMGEEQGDTWVVDLLAVVVESLRSRLLEEADPEFQLKPSWMRIAMSANDFRDVGAELVDCSDVP